VSDWFTSDILARLANWAKCNFNYERFFVKNLAIASRRGFLTSLATASGVMMMPGFAGAAPVDGINVLGPKPGYTPQIGTLVSMLTWMRPAVTKPVKGITQANLDYLFDANANSIGALLLHLAATETLYQLMTFEGLEYEHFPKVWTERWDAAMNLGDAGRKKRDDAWLMAVDPKWPWGPTNNYCKWFHVCEHESHHAGQIDLLLKRLPGAKPSAG
jgi:hypothetical protein